MAFPYSSQADQPQGFSDITINGVVYTVNSINPLPASENRVISRREGNGRRKDFMIEVGGEQVIVEMELQKATTTTPAPPAGIEVSYPVDQEGVDRDLVTVDGAINRSKEAFTTFTQRFVYVVPLEPPSIQFSMLYSEPPSRGSTSQIDWSIPAEYSAAVTVEVWDNTASQEANTLDTFVETEAAASGSYVFAGNYWAAAVPEGVQTWPTVGIRYVMPDGRKSEFAYLNFTMPTTAGLHTFP